MSRESILEAVRAASIKNPITPVSVKHFDSMVYDRENLLEVYMHYQKANMAHLVTTDKKNLTKSINAIIKENNIQELLCAKNITALSRQDSGQSPFIESLQTKTFVYEESVDSMRDKLFSIEASILHAQVGVANLGILGLGTNEANPRLASLIVKTCIILLHKKDIVPNLFSAFARLKTSGQEGALPTNIVFLAGPSRTADIELQTVFGVHGPQNVYVVLYE